jgi:uridylate kinase
MEMKDKREIVIVSVGGSLIFPEEIDVSWIKEFKKVVEKNLGEYRFAFICGGGKICRKYQNALREINPDVEDSDLDWLGIGVTKLNANFIKMVFGTKAHEKIVDNPNRKIDFKEDILIAGGWKPGCSTDKDAILLAKNLKVRKVINFTNIDYVYDKDPRKYPEAKPIRSISWKDFRKILPREWSPGLNSPFDPMAAKEAEKLGIEVAVLNGKNLGNFENYLNKKHTIGTIIS